MKGKRQATIKTNLKQFCNHWLTFTKPLHNLSLSEVNVLALFLFYYIEYKEVVKSDKLIWKLVFDYDVKAKIKEELNFKDQTLQNILYNLRRKNIIKDNRISPSFIPNMPLGAEEFELTFKFKINNESKVTEGGETSS